MNEAAAGQHPEYDEHKEQFARLIAKCWADENFVAVSGIQRAQAQTLCFQFD